jgi:Rod binding domain-containing protein
MATTNSTVTLYATNSLAGAHPSTREVLSSLDSTPAGRKLKRAAAEFESMLLSTLWKSMKSTFADSGDESSDPAHDSLEDFGIQTMSGAVAKAGGIGLGNLILKHLAPKLAASKQPRPLPAPNPSAFYADKYL